jgi:hypothetical protein
MTAQHLGAKSLACAALALALGASLSTAASARTYAPAVRAPAFGHGGFTRPQQNHFGPGASHGLSGRGPIGYGIGGRPSLRARR